MLFTRDKIMAIILLITILLISLLLSSYTEGLEDMVKTKAVEAMYKREQFKLSHK
jgi:hypothetical protein